MGHNEAFLESIRETPDDDAPRLIYADWLDEHGHVDEADFIRTQCTLHTTDSFDPQRIRLKTREDELFRKPAIRAYCKEWKQKIGTCLSRRAGFTVEMKRGFPADLWVHGSVIKNRLRSVMETAPVDGLFLQSDPEVESLFREECATKIHRLCVQFLSENDAGALWTSKYATGLKELYFGYDWLANDDYIYELIQSAFLHNLHTLHLPNQRVSAEGFSALFRSDRHCWQDISVSENRHIYYNWAESINLHPHSASSLKRLDVSRCGLSDRSILAIGEHGLPQLQECYLSDNFITTSGALALLSPVHFPQLRRLSLWRNNIPARDIENIQRIVQGRIEIIS